MYTKSFYNIFNCLDNILTHTDYILRISSILHIIPFEVYPIILNPQKYPYYINRTKKLTWNSCDL